MVETNRPDAKNALYQDAIKEGDKLLSINGKSLRGMDFKIAKQLLNSLPLELTFGRIDKDLNLLHKEPLPLKLRFSPFDSQKHELVRAWPTTEWGGVPTSSVPRWLQAGLAAINGGLLPQFRSSQQYFNGPTKEYTWPDESHETRKVIA